MNRRGTVLRACVAVAFVAARDAAPASTCARHAYAFDGAVLDGWSNLDATGDASVTIAKGWNDGGVASARVVNRGDRADLRLSIPDRRSVASVEMSGTMLVAAGASFTPIALYLEDEGQKDDHSRSTTVSLTSPRR